MLLLREEMPLAERFTKATRDQWEQLSTGPVLIDYDPAAPSDRPCVSVSFFTALWACCKFKFK